MDIVLIRDVFVSVCTGGLIAIGTAIVLRNGRTTGTPARRWRVLGNVSSLLLALFGFFVLLVVAQDFMGVRQNFFP